MCDPGNAHYSVDLSRFVTASQYEYIQDLEERRRRRNRDILAKITELESTAALHAARSKQLQQMRVEYEDLVGKYYTSSLKGRHAYHVNSFGAGGWKMDDAATNLNSPFSTTAPVPIITSIPRRTTVFTTTTGCNTEISGPVVSSIMYDPVNSEGPSVSMVHQSVVVEPILQSLATNMEPAAAVGPIDKLPPPAAADHGEEDSTIREQQLPSTCCDLSTTEEDFSASMTHQSGEDGMDKRALTAAAIVAINKLLAQETPDNSTAPTTTSFSARVLERNQGTAHTDDDDASMSAGSLQSSSQPLLSFPWKGKASSMETQRSTMGKAGGPITTVQKSHEARRATTSTTVPHTSTTSSTTDSSQNNKSRLVDESKLPITLPLNTTSHVSTVAATEEGLLVGGGGADVVVEGGRIEMYSEEESSTSGEEEVSDLSHQSPKHKEEIPILTDNEEPSTSRAAAAETSYNEALIPTNNADQKPAQLHIGNIDVAQDEGDHESEEAGRVGVAPVLEMKKSPPAMMPPRRGKNKFRVKLGYSDSEGSDLSEIGATKPVETNIPAPPPGGNNQQQQQTKAPPPMADLDDFFDF